MYLRQRGLTFEGFMEQLKQDVLVGQVRYGIVQSAFALPSELDNEYALSQQERDFRYQIFPAKQYQGKVNVTDSQIESYYNKHQDDYKLPEKVAINYIELSLAKLEQQQSITEQQVQQYYQQNPQMFKTQEQRRFATIQFNLPDNATPKQIKEVMAKAKDLAKELKQGADFAAQAKAVSDDPVSAKNGGLLPWLTAQDMDVSLGEKFEKAAFKLENKGDMSKPLQTRYGINIVKLVDIRPAQARPLAQVRDQIKQSLAAQAAEKIFSNKSAKLADVSYEQPDSLKPTAKALDVKINSTDLFSKKASLVVCWVTLSL